MGPADALVFVESREIYVRQLQDTTGQPLHVGRHGFERLQDDVPRDAR
jgi:hypothetical protein